MALQAAAATGVGIEEAAIRALTTVRQVLPTRLRHRLDVLDFTAIPAGNGPRDDDPVAADVLVAISTAIRARETLRFDYADADGARTREPSPPRRVQPHHLVTSNRRWYLVAWDLEREAWRVFRADRISPRIPTGPRFTPREVPGADVAAFVSARFKGRPTWTGGRAAERSSSIGRRPTSCPSRATAWSRISAPTDAASNSDPGRGWPSRPA